MYLALGTKRPAITLSSTRFGNELKPAIAHTRGNRTHRPYHTCACTITVTPVTASGLGPRNCGLLRFNPHRQTLTIARLNRPGTWNRATTARRGTTWTIQSATAYTKLSDRKHTRQRRSAVPPALTSQTVIIRSNLLHRPREAETHQCILYRTPTCQTLRPALIGLTHRHARLPAERKILSRDTASAAAPDSRSLHTAITSRETSTTTVRSLSLLPKMNRITRSLQSST